MVRVKESAPIRRGLLRGVWLGQPEPLGRSEGVRPDQKGIVTGECCGISMPSFL